MAPTWMFHPPREDRRSHLWSSSSPWYLPLVDTQYANLLQKYRASSLRWGKRERERSSELQYRQHHPILTPTVYCVAKSWNTTGFVAVSALRRRRRTSGRSGWLVVDVEPNTPYGRSVCDSYGRCRHSRSLQAYSRQCRFGRGGKGGHKLEKARRRLVRKSLSLWARLTTLERPDRDRRDRWYRRWFKRPRVRTDPIATWICLETTSLSPKPPATWEKNKLKLIQWSWWQSRCAPPSAFLTSTWDFFWYTLGDPLVVEDYDEEKTGKTGGSTSMESEISTVHLQSSQPKEQPKTHGCLSHPTTTEHTTEHTTSPFDRPISPSVALSRDPAEQAIRGGAHGAAATVSPPTPVPSLPSSRATSGPRSFSIGWRGLEDRKDRW